MHSCYFCVLERKNINMNLSESYLLLLYLYHPTGDVTRVFVVQGKVTVKIGEAENWWRGYRDNNQLKKANISVVLK